MTIENTNKRVILHCDMNGFFASVELLDYPELKNVPMAVCGDPDSRHGIILAKNQLAKEAGVVTAETIGMARKKCPNLHLVPPHMEKYRFYSKKINEIYLRYTDMVEPFSIDESWLDVTASQKLFGSGKEIADDIRKTVRSELGLTLSAGVSYNKLLAKMGSEYKKPDATTVITEDNFRDLLWKQPASNLFGVGRATAEKLKKLRINFIGDIARTDKKQLMALLGKQGDLIWNYANGIDHSPVALYSQREPVKSVGNGITFKRNLTTYDDISTAVKSLSDTVASRLRQYGLKAYGVKVTIKDPNFNVISRQKQFASPTWLSNEIATAAMDLMDCKGNFCSPIRMLTVTCINLTADPAQEQLSIFDEDLESRERSEKMEFTIDEVRKKYGSDAIVFASSIKNDLGI